MKGWGLLKGMFTLVNKLAPTKREVSLIPRRRWELIGYNSRYNLSWVATHEALRVEAMSEEKSF